MKETITTLVEPGVAIRQDIWASNKMRGNLTDPVYERGSVTDPAVHAAAAKAIELIADGARVGLGSGRAVTVFISKLGELQRESVRVTCVCASLASTHEARRAGLSVTELGEVEALDLTVDGADEV